MNANYEPSIVEVVTISGAENIESTDEETLKRAICDPPCQ